jgi:hypothetical protein
MINRENFIQNQIMNGSLRLPIGFLRIRPNNADIDRDFIMYEQPESNLRFLLGFLLGLLINLYGILIIACCNLRPKFRLGLKIGIIIGTFIFFVYKFMNPNNFTR